MKIVKIPERLNVILRLNEKESFIASNKLTIDTQEISGTNHLSRLYMQKIGFTPFKAQRGTVIKRVEVNWDSSVSVQDFTDYGGGSGSCHNSERYESIYDIFTLKEIFNDFCFITSYFDENKNELMLVKNLVKVNDSEEATIEEIDSFTVSFVSKKGLVILKDNKIIEEDKLESFFKSNKVDEKDEYIKKLIRLIYDNFSGEVGFNDIYRKYKSFLFSTPRQLDEYNLFRYYYYLGQVDYYLLAENLIKNELQAKLEELNPIYTGKPIPNPKDVFTLSKISMEILKENRAINDNEYQTILTDMEKHPKIGVNGIQLVREISEMYSSIGRSYDSPFRSGLGKELFKGILITVKTFDISIKNLMERCIRASFNEGCNPYDFIRIIIDYIQMSKQLSLPIEDKLPKDIFRRHDLLQGQIRYLMNAEIEKQFNLSKVKNDKLLAFLPKNKDLTIISPKNPNDLIEEGLKMNHCVGSYIDRYVIGSSKIFFVRLTTDIDVSYVTIELNNRNELIQAKAHSNRTPDKNVLNFINEWIKNIK